LDDWQEDFAAAREAIDRQKRPPPFRSIVVYAWNEFTEGGWMAPTWSDPSDRMARLRAAIGRDRQQSDVKLRFPSDITVSNCPVRTAPRTEAQARIACARPPEPQFRPWPCPPGMRVASDLALAPSGLERRVWPGSWVERECVSG
jgi:hypothetical protein